MKNNENMKLWENFRSVPDEAKKPIVGHPKLKGYTDINPVWRQKKLTQMFGPVGLGWYTETTKEWTENGANGEVLYFVKINLFVKYNNEWSKPIEGQGGNKLINKFSKGLDSNDEALKMAYTDALSVSCKALGIAADVYFEKDRTKYDLYDDELNNNDYGKNTIPGNKNKAISRNTQTNISKTNEELINEKQIKVLYAKAYSVGLNDVEVKEKMKEKFSKESSKELTKSEHKYLCDLFDTFPKVIGKEDKKKIIDLMKLAGVNKQQIESYIKKDFRKILPSEVSKITSRLNKTLDKNNNSDELPVTTPSHAVPAQPVK